MGKLAEEICNAFKDNDWELEEDTLIRGILFKEGAYIGDILEEFGYRCTHLDYLVCGSGEQTDVQEIYEAKNEFWCLYDDDAIFHLGEPYWDCTQEDGEFGSGMSPVSFWELYWHCKNLDDLLHVMQNHPDEYGTQWSDMELPTFGGEEPEDTVEVWSWDEKRMIVGACSYELEIVDREVSDG